ncbi:MAG TPA: hypothetical protein VN228_04955 [Pyrinomonadaceae bacterium]|nr:hypothetical protein [Pyrinomonadaceae bacterium]
MRLVAYLCLIAVCFLVAPTDARAQRTRATVTLTGQVSGFVAVSAGPGARVLKGDARVSAGRVGARTLVFSLSGLNEGETQLDIPVQVRSNVEFTLTTSYEVGGAAFSDVSVVGVGGAGRLVFPGAASRVVVAPAFDARHAATPPAAPALSSPVALLHGPPVSMGGTLESPANALEVVLRLVVRAPAGARGADAELLVSVAPRPKGL